ncbi:MAG: glycosyltransferase family 2 protein [Nanoarchaeota archaeon]
MVKISVILPCRNEEKTIGVCIEKIKKALVGKDYEIIVSDSSKDSSAKIASKKEVKVIKHDKEGYGAAYLEGFKAVNGDYIIIGDCDNTYDFLEISKFIDELDKGFDLVVGQRKKIVNGAMPFLHRYVGNPFLSFILRLFFRAKIKDSQSGFRAIRKKRLDKLNLSTKGMEFASEMIVQALKNKLKISEIPITYYPRIGESKLRSFNDGWKHLRFMLLYSPLYLFLIPGIFLFILGLIIMARLLFGPITIFNLTFTDHPFIIGSFLTIVGYQIINLGLFAKVYAITHLNEKNKIVSSLIKYITLERAILLGILLFFIGLIIDLIILLEWFNSGFGGLAKINLAIFGTTIIIMSMQTVFSGFFLSILGIKK